MASVRRPGRQSGRDDRPLGPRRRLRRPHAFDDDRLRDRRRADGDAYSITYVANGTDLIRTTPGGKTTPIAVPNGSITNLMAGSDGIYFLGRGTAGYNVLERLDADGTLTAVIKTPVSAFATDPDLAFGPDGNLWFTEGLPGYLGGEGLVGRVVLAPTPVPIAGADLRRRPPAPPSILFGASPPGPVAPAGRAGPARPGRIPPLRRHLGRFGDDRLGRRLGADHGHPRPRPRRRHHSGPRPVPQRPGLGVPCLRLGRGLRRHRHDPGDRPRRGGDDGRAGRDGHRGRPLPDRPPFEHLPGRGNHPVRGPARVVHHSHSARRLGLRFHGDRRIGATARRRPLGRSGAAISPRDRPASPRRPARLRPSTSTAGIPTPGPAISPSGSPWPTRTATPRPRRPRFRSPRAPW